MGAMSVNWRPDYSLGLMRRELDIIRGDLQLMPCGWAATIFAACWKLPATRRLPGSTLDGPGVAERHAEADAAVHTEAAAAPEPLFLRWPDRLSFCVGNEFTLFMRGIVPGCSHARRTRSPILREIALSDQQTLRGV
jgi:hypothetical protein